MNEEFPLEPFLHVCATAVLPQQESVSSTVKDTSKTEADEEEGENRQDEKARKWKRGRESSGEWRRYGEGVSWGGEGFSVRGSGIKTETGTVSETGIGAGRIGKWKKYIEGARERNRLRLLHNGKVGGQDNPHLRVSICLFLL